MKLNSGKYTNIYRALVVSNYDPEEIGRIQVRVPFLHGVSNQGDYIDDKNLPYAVPCSPFATHDAGMLLVPEVGSMVFLMFEDGDSTKPVYLGQMFSKGSIKTEELSYTESDMFKENGYRLKMADIDDTPKNSYKDGSIKKQVLFKSIKGSTIQFNDNDCEESLEIYDRLGQSFIMHSPVTSEENETGINNRGIFSVVKKLFNRVINLPSMILLKSLSGSKLRIISHKDYSKVDLLTVYKDLKAGIHVKIGKDGRLVLHYGESKFEITESSTTIDSSNVNIKANTLNFSANEINSSSNIYVGKVDIKSVEIPIDDNDELNIKGVD